MIATLTAMCVCLPMLLLVRSSLLCSCASITDMHTCVSSLCQCVYSHLVCVCVCVRPGQPGLSSQDNQSWALVRQPSEAERGKAGADVGVFRSCVGVCGQR